MLFYLFFVVEGKNRFECSVGVKNKYDIVMMKIYRIVKQLKWGEENEVESTFAPDSWTVSISWGP